MYTNTIKPVTLKKSGILIPENSPVFITVSEERPTKAKALFEEQKIIVFFDTVNLSRYFEGFIEVSIETLEDAVFDNCLSMTGEDIEPDGWDSQGFPSVLLAAGLC
jgi:hypothetical protein